MSSAAFLEQLRELLLSSVLVGNFRLLDGDVTHYGYCYCYC